MRPDPGLRGVAERPNPPTSVDSLAVAKRKASGVGRKRDRSLAREKKAAEAFRAKPSSRTLKTLDRSRNVRAGRTRQLRDAISEPEPENAVAALTATISTRFSEAARMNDEPLRYAKRTSRRWRPKLEILEGRACCICRRRPPVSERVFDRMWAAMLSGGEPLPEDTLSMLWIDHDHDTGTVRGLLCSDCNAAIFPLEFGRPMDHVRQRYLADGDRLQRAKSHMAHVVVKGTHQDLRLVTLDAGESRLPIAHGPTGHRLGVSRRRPPIEERSGPRPRSRVRRLSLLRPRP